MASLTVRQLDDKLKKLLRLRAARNGRSMEDEVRVILREAAEQPGTRDDVDPPSRPARQQGQPSWDCSPPRAPGPGCPSQRPA